MDDQSIPSTPAPMPEEPVTPTVDPTGIPAVDAPVDSAPVDAPAPEAPAVPTPEESTAPAPEDTPPAETI